MFHQLSLTVTNVLAITVLCYYNGLLIVVLYELLRFINLYSEDYWQLLYQLLLLMINYFVFLFVILSTN